MLCWVCKVLSRVGKCIKVLLTLKKSALEPQLMAPYGPMHCHMVPNESMKVRKKHVNSNKRHNGLPY